MAGPTPAAPPAAAVRLYVSGLAPPSADLPAALTQRFSSFGAVNGVTVPRPTDAQRGALDGGASPPPETDPVRGFAYVDLVPNDDASVRRAVAAVSSRGCGRADGDCACS